MVWERWPLSEVWQSLGHSLSTLPFTVVSAVFSVVSAVRLGESSDHSVRECQIPKLVPTHWTSVYSDTFLSFLSSLWRSPGHWKPYWNISLIAPVFEY